MCLPDWPPRHWCRNGRRLLQNRPLKAADGSTVSLADLPQNQAKYPEQKGQQRVSSLRFYMVICEDRSYACFMFQRYASGIDRAAHPLFPGQGITL